jgi:hypothetical protein
MASKLLEIKKCKCGGDIIVEYRIDHHDREWIEEYCEECDHSDVEPYYDEYYFKIMLNKHIYYEP